MARDHLPLVDEDSAAGWIERARRGDRAAFLALYDAFAPAVLAYLVRRLRDRSQAGEALEDVFSQALSPSQDWEGMPPAAGLLLITRQQAQARLLDRGRRRSADHGRNGDSALSTLHVSRLPRHHHVLLSRRLALADTLAATARVR